jgi:hypothetical protein
MLTPTRYVARKLENAAHVAAPLIDATPYGDGRETGEGPLAGRVEEASNGPLQNDDVHDARHLLRHDAVKGFALLK